MATKYAYEYGARWNAMTPRSDIGWLVDAMHVGEPPEAVREAIEARLPKDNPAFTASVRKECVKYALLRHNRNYKAYRRIMDGY